MSSSVIKLRRSQYNLMDGSKNLYIPLYNQVRAQFAQAERQWNIEKSLLQSRIQTLMAYEVERRDIISEKQKLENELKTWKHFQTELIEFIDKNCEQSIAIEGQNK